MCILTHKSRLSRPLDRTELHACRDKSSSVGLCLLIYTACRVQHYVATVALFVITIESALVLSADDLRTVTERSRPLLFMSHLLSACFESRTNFRLTSYSSNSTVIGLVFRDLTSSLIRDGWAASFIASSTITEDSLMLLFHDDIF